MTHHDIRLALATLNLLSLADVHGLCHADLNGNDMVDNHDLLILLADYGATCEEAGWHDPILSEIHYNPSTQQGTDSDHEFLELTNPHPFDLHLGGWSIADGIDCAFPLTRGSKPEVISWSPTILTRWGVGARLHACLGLVRRVRPSQQWRNLEVGSARRLRGPNRRVQRHKWVARRSRRWWRLFGMAGNPARQRLAHFLGGQFSLGRISRIAQQHLGRLTSSQVQGPAVHSHRQSVARQQRHVCAVGIDADLQGPSAELELERKG